MQGETMTVKALFDMCQFSVLVVVYYVFQPSCCVCFLLSLLLFLSSSFLWVSSRLPPASCSDVISSTCDLVCVFCLCQIIACFHPSAFSLASPERWHLFFYLFYFLHYYLQCFICLSL